MSLAGCGTNFAQQAREPAGQNPADVGGQFDWRREEGKTINLIFAKHPMSDSYIANLEQFKEKTGIEAKYDALPEEEFRQKLQTDLSTGQGTYDVFMTGPVTNWQYATAGWIAPLDDYLKNPALTEASYDFDDFYPATIEVNRWDRQEGLGKGSLWALPANEEGYSLFYRRDILEEAGIDVPRTFDELLTAARELDGKTFAGKKVDGFVARGDKTWPTITTGYSTMYFASGATDVKDGKVAVNSPEGIEATEKWAELMSYSPDNVGTFTWYEAMNHFAAGNAAFFIDADHMSETFEDPESSSVADRVGYAPPPAGTAGITSNIWLWSLGMASQSKNNVAAWLFLQWATTKEQLKRSIPEGNINPTRQSLANSQTMKEYTEDWSNYNEVWQTILADHAKWRFAASPKFPEMGDRWALAVQEVVLGNRSAKEALDAAAKEMQSALDSAQG
jgi:multiple sugar transport system substrate-binding protein